MVGNFSKTIYRFYLFNQKGDGGGVRVKGTRDCVLLHFINYPFINYPFINYPFIRHAKWCLNIFSILQRHFFQTFEKLTSGCQ